MPSHPASMGELELFVNIRGVFDRPVLLQAWQDFAHHTELAEDERFVSSNAEVYLTNFLDDGGLGFVAMDGDTIAGVITCSVLDSPSYFRDPKHLFINDVAVSPGHRRQVVGQLLESHCEQYAKDHGINLVMGEIYAYNDASREMVKKLDRKLGYEVWYKRLGD